MNLLRAAVLFLLTLGSLARGKEIRTNNLIISNAPEWMSSGRLERLTNQVQSFMEWDIRRPKVFFYTDRGEFEKSHGLGPAVRAYYRSKDNTVHVGPDVDDKVFDEVFKHELSHVCSFQKYKGAIPSWLEEGMANYVAHRGTVDYVWLAAQPDHDVTKLVHPFGAASDPRYHYMASTALVEMIAAKCSLSDLLQLSVGKKLETYLSTYCEINDINSAFKDWLKKKAPAVKVSSSPSVTGKAAAPADTPKPAPGFGPSSIDE